MAKQQLNNQPIATTSLEQDNTMNLNKDAVATGSGSSVLGGYWNQGASTIHQQGNQQSTNLQHSSASRESTTNQLLTNWVW